MALSLRLGIPIGELRQRLTAADVAEYMAADALDAEDRAAAAKQAELAGRAGAGLAPMVQAAKRG